MESNAGHRKLSRRVNATTGGHHGVGPWRDDAMRKIEKKFGREPLLGLRVRGIDRLKRAMKKRLKTREERAFRRGEF